MKYCPNCGLRYNTAQCPKCFPNQSHPTVTPIPGPQRSDWPAGQQAPLAQKPTRNKNSGVNILAIMLGLLAVIIAAVVILMPKRGEIVFPNGTYNGQKLFGKARATAPWNTTTAMSMSASGNPISAMVKVPAPTPTEMSTKASGKTASDKVRVPTHGPTAVNMWASGKITTATVRAPTQVPTEAFMWESTQMTNAMDRAP